MSQETTSINTELSKDRSFLSGLSEDIWAVIIGSVLIVFILLMTFFTSVSKFAAPVYQWEDLQELQRGVFAGSNLLFLGAIGIIFFFVVFIGCYFIRKQARQL